MDKMWRNPGIPVNLFTLFASPYNAWGKQYKFVMFNPITHYV